MDGEKGGGGWTARKKVGRDSGDAGGAVAAGGGGGVTCPDRSAGPAALFIMCAAIVIPASIVNARAFRPPPPFARASAIFRCPSLCRRPRGRARAADQHRVLCCTAAAAASILCINIYVQAASPAFDGWLNY